MTVGLMVTPLTIFPYPDQPTDDQLVAWWAGITTEERLEQLRNLDRYENELPSIDFPDYDVIVTDDQIVMRPRAPLTMWLINLGWTVQGPTHYADYEPVKPNLWGVRATWFVVGILGGIGLSLIFP